MREKRYEENSLYTCNVCMKVMLPPWRSGSRENVQMGIVETLNSMVMVYCEKLDGVVRAIGDTFPFQGLSWQGG